MRNRNGKIVLVLSLNLLSACTLMISSCTSEKKATASSSDGARGALTALPPTCADYTAEECNLNESCHGIQGYDLDKEKVDFIGCVENNADGGTLCNEAISCFTDLEKTRKVILTNGCHPKEWEYAECSEEDQKSLDDFFSQGGSF